MLKKEMACLEKIVYPKRLNDSKWGVPYLSQYKRSGTVQLISKIRDINRKIKCNPYPMSKKNKNSYVKRF